jgi:hypothetical protein
LLEDDPQVGQLDVGGRDRDVHGRRGADELLGAGDLYRGSGHAAGDDKGAAAREEDDQEQRDEELHP